MIQTKLSVITINKNNAAGLEKTIRSVINQSYVNFEYIVIDGYSTDNSTEIIKKYASQIHYWISEPDTGTYNAMNKGIKKATGEYVIFMNSGDCFINNQILSNVFLKEHHSDLLIGNIIQDGNFFKQRKIVSHKITFYYLLTEVLWHQATFTKRSLFDEIGFYDEQLKITSDWKFALLALVKYNKSFEILDENIALVETKGISGSDEANVWIKEEQDETIRTYFPFFYDDYKTLYRLKRFSYHRLKQHIIWRLRKIIYR
jgi:glycosyltransferase involved in cell wall biosynthesis